MQLELLPSCTFYSRSDAFGEKVGNEGAIANKYLFAGEQFDLSLGDYYLRDRFYNFQNGIFVMFGLRSRTDTILEAEIEVIGFLRSTIL